MNDTSQYKLSLGYTCHRHPAVETMLRCRVCNRFICPKCAKHTPVGYFCSDCLRQREAVYFNGQAADYLVAVLIALPLSFVIATAFTFFLRGFWFITFLAAPFLAGLIAEAVRLGVSGRRTRYLAHVVAGCLILGALPSILFPWLLFSYLSGDLTAFSFFMIEPAMLLIFGIGTIMVRLR